MPVAGASVDGYRPELERTTSVDEPSDDAENAVVEPGHGYTIEPGLYTDGAGYHHSDAVAVTGDGTEVPTDVPRELEATVIP